jgi:Leucine-rich repeat (LRR) protein
MGLSGLNRSRKSLTLCAMRTPRPATGRKTAQSRPRKERARFAALLAGHLGAGIRPATATGEPWTYAEFAREVVSSRDHAGDHVSPRSVSNWCNGTALPGEIDPILRALFGPSDRHAAAREELRKAFIAARDEKSAEIVGRAKREPAGGNWVVDAERDQFVLDRSVRPTDRRAASDPLRTQLQRAIRDAAAELRRTAGRVANSLTWSGLPVAAEGFHAIVDRQPAELPEWLGEAYALMLRLGRFLDTDRRVRADRGLADDPLDPDIHGALTDLVQLAAPWLRGFPTVASWDDAAGRTLVRAELFQPARDFARTARAEDTIAERDAAEIELLAETADSVDFLGQKAGNRLVGDAWNLLLALASVRAAARTGAGIDPEALLVRRVAATLAAATDEMQQLAASRPGDLREALRTLAEEASPNNDPAAGPAAPVPEDVEKRVRDMILEGRAPPAAWRPFIRRLDFDDSNLDRLDLLSPLSQLQRLDADSTRIADLAPLAGMSGLQFLSLTGTKVADLAPLAGMSRLQTLWLNGTPVTDLVPLAGMRGLQELYLDGTPVTDLAPLAGISGLQFLSLTGTSVTDLAPLAGMSRLQFLSLTGTSVTNLTPLAGMRGLQTLYLDGTPVADLAPLAGMSGLQFLWLDGTPVTDLAPLAGMRRLRRLYLAEGQEVDLTPLAGLKDLQIIREPRPVPAEPVPETNGAPR